MITHNRHNPKDRHRYHHRRGNLKSHTPVSSSEPLEKSPLKSETGKEENGSNAQHKEFRRGKKSTNKTK